MSGYKGLDPQQRQSIAAATKKAMLEKFRAAAEDPVAEARRIARVAVSEARLVRAVERAAAKASRKAELAEQAARATELVEQAKRNNEQAAARAAAEKLEREAALEAERKGWPGCSIRRAQSRKESAAKRLLTVWESTYLPAAFRSASTMRSCQPGPSSWKKSRMSPVDAQRDLLLDARDRMVASDRRFDGAWWSRP